MTRNEGDHITPPVRMDQSMTVAAVMISQLIGTFGKSGDSEEELSTLHLACLGVFLYQLLVSSKHKDKVAAMLEAIIVELRDPQPTAEA